jgi:hypothetical protein
LPHFFKQASPSAPGQHNQRISVVAFQKQAIKTAKPSFERAEASAVLSALHFADERSLIRPECIDVDVMSTTAKATGSGQRIAFSVHAKRSVQGDDFSFNAIALTTMTRATHVQFALLFVGSFVWFL